jgi:hypothetical protein
MRYKVKKNAILIYGLKCKACVRFIKGQKWDLIKTIESGDGDKLYVLDRGNVQVHVGKEDIENFFEKEE